MPWTESAGSARNGPSWPRICRRARRWLDRARSSSRYRGVFHVVSFRLSLLSLNAIEAWLEPSTLPVYRFDRLPLTTVVEVFRAIIATQNEMVKKLGEMTRS
jgi:hypothetical protein